MKRIQLILAAVLLGSISTRELSATDIAITSFNGNGVLTWTNTIPNAAYRVEWAPSLSSSWTNSWANLVGIQTTNSTCSVSVPLFYRVVGQQPPMYSFPDYFPTDPNMFQRRVSVATNFLSASGSLITNEFTGFMAAPYAAGTIVGVVDSQASYFYNNGNTVRFLGSAGWFRSTDTNLTTHPSCWSFGQVYDGMVVSQSCYNVTADGSKYDGPNTGYVLIRIQTVTVMAGSYSNAVVFWYLDEGKPYLTVDFHGTLSELGLILPTAVDTRGYSVTGLEVYGRNAGLIAYGEIKASTGNLLTLQRLQSIVSP